MGLPAHKLTFTSIAGLHFIDGPSYQIEMGLVSAMSYFAHGGLPD